jgi:hydrogenase-1 operon protein HyaF
MTKPFPMPVRMTGPGSQHEDEELQYLAMPRDMSTFEMPRVPDAASPDVLAGARAVLAAFAKLFDDASPSEPARLDLSGVPAAQLRLVNEMLGEGEVSIQLGGATPFRIQESIFAGVWRVCALDADGALTADWLEAGPVPQIVLAAARDAAAGHLAPVELPPGAMNSPALIAEIGAELARGRGRGSAHVINLTLLPLTPDDHMVLERALPVGPVAIMSRGFGNCRVTSTAARDVWRVQYFNSMNTLILNTIEVVEMPEVALAAAEDLDDSRTRLAELIEWIDESAADAEGCEPAKEAR